MAEPAPGAVCLLDFSARPEAARMRIAGMTLLERKLRELEGRGVERVLVAGDLAHTLPGVAGIELVGLATGAEAPAGVERVDGTIVQGVQIRDEASRRSAEWALMQTCRRPYDGPGDCYVIRSFSLRVTRFLTRFAVRPNHVTVVSLLVGLSASALVALGVTWMVRLAGLLIFLQVILDSSDGELARVRFMGSKFGMWLDNLTDDIVDTLFPAAVGVGLGGPWLIVGLAGAAMRVTWVLVVYRQVGRIGKPGDVLEFHWWFEKPDAGHVERFGPGRRGLTALRSIARRDVFVLIYFAFCAAGWPIGAVVLGSGLGAAYFALTLVHLVKR